MMKKRKKKKRRIGFRIFVGIQIFLMVLVLGGLAFYYLGGYGEQVSAMKEEAVTLVARSSDKTFRSEQTSLVYDANGTLISALKGEKDVYYIEMDRTPEYAKAAIVSSEDKKFYSHSGYDIKGILRAIKMLIQDGEITQGGSTITQQLARNVFLTQDRTWQRKLQEIFVAVELEKKYDKEKILEFYLNNIYFGNGYYGIQAASKGYFDIDVQNLSLSQIVFLCAIPNNPSMYDPLEHMDQTLARRDRILKQMQEDGKISLATCQEAMAESIVLNRPEKTKYDYVETYTYYCATRALMEQEGFVFRTEFGTESERQEYLKAYEELYSSCQAKLYKNGYRIYTSLDLGMQEQLQGIIDDVLSDYTETNEEGVYTLQSSAVCIDNHTGMVKAIVGGRDQSLPGYTLNRAYQSFRQPGSVIKPILVYTPALERGYLPESILLDEEIEDGPENADKVYSGEITLRQAVEKSKNTTAWKMLEEITPEAGLSYLHAMKFVKLSREDVRLPSALGGLTTGTSAVEIASAYACIANDGKYRTPTCIRYITDADGTVIYESAQEEVQVYEQNAARMMTNVLQGVLTEGTGKGLSLEETASAGKTGTTNENKDGWFAGYTRYYTTSVWVGYDMPKRLPDLTGSSYPGLIWKRFMQGIHQGEQYLEFLPYIKTEVPEPEEEQEHENTENIEEDVTEEM